MSNKFLKKVRLLAKSESMDLYDEITLDSNFETMCYGNGKNDDITVSILWI